MLFPRCLLGALILPALLTAPVEAARAPRAPRAAAQTESLEGRDAREARWSRLSSDIHPGRWWVPRITTYGGQVTEPIRMSGTTAAQVYHESAVDHPVTSRFVFAETWKGMLRHTKAINLLIKDRESGKVVAEVATWEGRGVRLATPTSITTFKTQGEALQAFFERQPGFKEAQKEAQNQSSPVTFRYYSLQYHGTEEGLAGLLRPSLADRSKLVLQWGEAWGGKDAERPVQRLDPKTLVEGKTIRLRPGEVLAAPRGVQAPEESRWSTVPVLTKIGQAEAPVSKVWPSYALFELPRDTEPGESFDLFVAEAGGKTRTIKVIAAK